MKTTAIELKPGDVITKAGATPHSPITVTAVKPYLTGLVQIFGFNSRDSSPRLMLRHLNESLVVEIHP